ncbi:MAG: hypothetical protein BHW64_01945 [Candidatus Melainabacteria bacterium LEY3_CP_29_8]|nr:MAG: hypothetical protein BHW64_01945 [Candidatus Melainabacteria bacterium LEY3_CP_29_8]
METYKKILSYLNKDYRNDDFTIDLTKTLQTKFQSLYDGINALKSNFYFDTLTIEGIKYFETLLGITPIETQTYNDRCATIQAKWLSNNHNCIKFIQDICNAWKNGRVKADFVNGKIKLVFIGEYGVPEDLDGLLSAINEIKPAHISYYFIFKYLLIENIHEVKTIEEMENLTLEMFAFGKEEI